MRSRSLADSARGSQHVRSRRLDGGQAGLAVQAEPAGDPGREQEGQVVTGDQDRAAVALQGLGELADRGQVQVVGRLVEQQQLGRGLARTSFPADDVRTPLG